MKTYFIHHFTMYLGIAVFLTGTLLRLLIGRRRFNRRGIAGLQLFSSYWKWWLTTRIESLIMVVAFLLLIAGIFLTLTGFYATLK